MVEQVASMNSKLNDFHKTYEQDHPRLQNDEVDPFLEYCVTLPLRKRVDVYNLWKLLQDETKFAKFVSSYFLSLLKYMSVISPFHFQKKYYAIELANQSKCSSTKVTKLTFLMDLIFHPVVCLQIQKASVPDGKPEENTTDFNNPKFRLVSSINRSL